MKNPRNQPEYHLPPLGGAVGQGDCPPVQGCPDPPETGMCINTKGHKWTSLVDSSTCFFVRK